MSKRLDQINDLIRDNISQIILKELSLKPGVFTSVIKVDTTSDMRYTRIFLSVFPITEQHYVMVTLKKELYRIQGFLNQQLQTKINPRIEFMLDEHQEQVSKIDKLIDQAHNEDQA